MFTVLLCKIYIALHTQAGQTAKEKMRITQVRDDGKVNTMRTLKIEQLVEQMKKDTSGGSFCQKKRGDGDGRI